MVQYNLPLDHLGLGSHHAGAVEDDFAHLDLYDRADEYSVCSLHSPAEYHRFHAPPPRHSWNPTEKPSCEMSLVNGRDDISLISRIESILRSG